MIGCISKVSFISNRDARTHDSFSHFDKHVRIIPIGFFSEGNNNLVFIAKFGCYYMI